MIWRYPIAVALLIAGLVWFYRLSQNPPEPFTRSRMSNRWLKQKRGEW